jgi:hypothetical protein
MSQSTAPDDRMVEEKLRQLLGPFDRHLEQGGSLMAAALVVTTPGVFLALWLLLEMNSKRALGWAAGAFGVLVVLGVGWDWVVVRLACWRFDRYFPLDSPLRASAVRILREMATPSMAEEKLLRVLSSKSPSRIVRRRGDAPEPPPASPPSAPTSPAPSHPEPPSERRPGGYYDYIPLEPRITEKDRPPEQGG